MKTSAGCTQPVHNILRRWIGGASFFPPSSHAKRTLRSPTNDGSMITTQSSMPHYRTYFLCTRGSMSTSTTRNVGARSPPLILGNTYHRHISGIGKVASPEEKSAAARVLLESKRGDGNVNVAPAAVDVPIDLDDLQDLNAEIAGFVGSLGDPDFDVQDNAPTTSPATDRRHGHHHPQALAGNDTDIRQQHHQQQLQQQQQQWTADNDLVGHTDLAEARDKDAPASHLQSRRLTLADRSTSSAGAGARDTITGDVSVKSQATESGFSWLEELRAYSAASSTQPTHAGHGERVPSGASSGIATGIHHADNQVASRSFEEKGRSGATKSVLVLNGPACFIGGRLASTGEPQVQVTTLMEEAAAEFNISLTVCKSNREHELLDELCAGNYDAVIYNPAGFSAEVVNRSSRRKTSSPKDPGHSHLDVRQPPQLEPARKQGLEDRNALEYGLIRARCPVVTLAPRDVHPGSRVSHGFGYMKGGISGHPPDHWGGYIAGFSGVVSYRLAIAAVADMLESEPE